MSEDPWPQEDTIYVLREGRRLGPFSLENLLDGLESGDFEADDICLREGAIDCERIRDLLDAVEADSDDPFDEADDSEGAIDEDDDEEEEEESWEDEPAQPRSPDPRTGEPSSTPPRPPTDRLLYAGHPSVLTYPVSLAALVGGVTGGIWLYGFDPKLTLAALGLATAGLIRLSLVRYCHDYHIRTRRIESVVGLLARNSREVRIEDIRAINVTCRGVSGMLGIGTIDFHTSGDAPEISFDRVWAARRIKALVRRLQDSP